MLFCGLPPATGLLAPGVAAIFDVDGVLLDSNPLHLETWAAYLKRFGIAFTPEGRQQMYGKHNDSLVQMLFGEKLTDEEVRAHGAAKEALYRERMAGQIHDRVAPGLYDLLDRLRGAPLGVASNGEEKNVVFVLDRLGIQERFQVWLHGESMARPKPHPDVYLLAAEMLRTDPRNCIIFEDSYAGVESAKAAGSRVVGVTTTHSDLAAGLLIHDFRDPKLEDWLRSQRPREPGPRGLADHG